MFSSLFFLLFFLMLNLLLFDDCVLFTHTRVCHLHFRFCPFSLHTSPLVTPVLRSASQSFLIYTEGWLEAQSHSSLSPVPGPTSITRSLIKIHHQIGCLLNFPDALKTLLILNYVPHLNKANSQVSENRPMWFLSFLISKLRQLKLSEHFIFILSPVPLKNVRFVSLQQKHIPCWLFLWTQDICCLRMFNTENKVLSFHECANWFHAS